MGADGRATGRAARCGIAGCSSAGGHAALAGGNSASGRAPRSFRNAGGLSATGRTARGCRSAGRPSAADCRQPGGRTRQYLR